MCAGCLQLVSKLCSTTRRRRRFQSLHCSVLVFQMQIFDYLIRASNAASLFQSEKGDLHDIVSNSYCKEQKFHFNIFLILGTCHHGYQFPNKSFKGLSCAIIMDRIPEIGFSGNQPKNGFKQIRLN